MVTQKQVALELIGKHVEEYGNLDVHHLYSARLDKAQELLIAEKVQRQADGSYTVQESQTEPYQVNGACTCVDFTMGHAPSGWCKHRLAA